MILKKPFYAILLIAVAFCACKKASSDTYETSSRSTSTTTSTAATPGTSERGTTPGITTASNYAVMLNNADQIVKIGLSNKTLNMNFYENINLYVRKDSLAISWSIIFTEDFTVSQLGKFSYTSVGKSGTVTTNYVESNLNNVTISATKDTTISNIVFTKVSFNRNFLFSNTYATSTEAATEYDYMLNNSETINFATYLNTALGKTTVIKSTSKLVYLPN